MTTGATVDRGVSRRSAVPKAPTLRPRPLGSTTPPAPASSAAAAKSAPSKRSPRTAMYSSPAPSVRVSIETPSISRAASPETMSPAIASATDRALNRISMTPLHDPGAGPAARQGLARHHHVIERQYAIADHLMLLVALARDEHEIPGSGQLDRRRNRL